MLRLNPRNMTPVNLLSTHLEWWQHNWFFASIISLVSLIVTLIVALKSPESAELFYKDDKRQLRVKYKR
ncbi:hypothetical protein SAMN06269250_5017 [Spirosoma fluviale]|uniref:Uncharacterized protein n=1 Tax=Spirosoma fluviale TaxID=1597977 RepID=A0A286GK04_9BACT|nr:hypothetical protein SAMN06269250_5017 [Spirosoma fluviale]